MTRLPAPVGTVSIAIDINGRDEVVGDWRAPTVRTLRGVPADAGRRGALTCHRLVRMKLTRPARVWLALRDILADKVK